MHHNFSAELSEILVWVSLSGFALSETAAARYVVEPSGRTAILGKARKRSANNKKSARLGRRVAR